jgi:hypothetical protein
MVYMNFLRRSSSRFCQQQQQALFVSAPAVTTAPISASASASIHRPICLRNFASVATSSTRTTTTPNHRESPFEQELPVSFPNNYNYIVTRSKHSSTQIKRLFKQNPARRRIARKDAAQNNNGIEEIGMIPESTIQPLISDPKILSNGWNAPIGGSSEHPFQVVRTKNKPNNALGFLPVYSEYR